MNKAQAKRIACLRIYYQVRRELDVGGYAEDEAVKDADDEERLRQALTQLRDELFRRAGDDEK